MCGTYRHHDIPLRVSNTQTRKRGRNCHPRPGLAHPTSKAGHRPFGSCSGRYITGLCSRKNQTKDFKDSLREANEYAHTLPGGELSVEEQDEVIEMLEMLKERKRYVFARPLEKNRCNGVGLSDGNWPNSRREWARYHPRRLPTSRWRLTRQPLHLRNPVSLVLLTWTPHPKRL